MIIRCKTISYKTDCIFDARKLSYYNIFYSNFDNSGTIKLLMSYKMDSKTNKNFAFYCMQMIFDKIAVIRCLDQENRPLKISIYIPSFPGPAYLLKS